MATIKPFRGVRYNAELVRDLSLVISQPYDRVRYGLQQQYYAQSPYNVVRIIKGKELPADAPYRPDKGQAGPNVYTRARATYDAWRAEGVLVQEGDPALYVYHQTFTLDGQTRTRKGFVAAFQLSPFEQGIVLPHERTHAGPKEDRLRLLRTLEVNTGQIFMLYPDPHNTVADILDAAIAGRAPDIDAVEMYEKDVRQQLWVVRDEGTIRAVQGEMAPKRNLIIADGHHRYETALNYARLASQGQAPADAAYNYCMAALVGMDDPGLTILPTHREVLNCPQVHTTDILARAASLFDIAPASGLEDCLAEIATYATGPDARPAFGLYTRDGYHVLALKSPDRVEGCMPGERSPEWKSLDVTIAHKVLLEQIIGLSEQALEQQAELRYHRDPGPAIESVNSGQSDLVLLLNATRIEQVRACAKQGEKMPQKSTDFYPKMIAGLTMMPVGE
jgi:uncharacterized protein (DUF1015 family)